MWYIVILKAPNGSMVQDFSVSQQGPVVLCNALFERETPLQIYRNEWNCGRTHVWYQVFKGRKLDCKIDGTETTRVGRMMKDSHGLKTSLACPVVILMPPLQQLF